MKENTKVLIQAIPGLAIQLQVQKKNYAFVHGEIKTKRNYTLGGLYSEDSEPAQTSQEATTASAVRESVWGENPTPEMRNHLGDALLILPESLTKIGIGVLDRQLQTFHDKAKQVKQAIVAKYPVGSLVPPAVMKKLEEDMKKYNLVGYTLKVTAIKITKDNPKGSRRRSDGLYESRQVLRTVFIDRFLTKENLTSLLVSLVEAIATPVLTEIAMTGGYRVNQSNGSLLFTPQTQTSFKYDGQDRTRSNNFGVPPGVKTSKPR